MDRRGRGSPPLAVPGEVRILEVVPAGERGSVIRLGVGDEPVVLRLPLAGDHNARNAAAALAVVLALGLPARPAAAAMERVVLPGHRSRFVVIGGRHVLDDCYNANPGSMSAALITLSRAAAGGRTFAVLGDMLELGDEADALHHQVGRQLGALGYAGVVALGAHAGPLTEGARAAGVPATRVQSPRTPPRPPARSPSGPSPPTGWWSKPPAASAWNASSTN